MSQQPPQSALEIANLVGQVNPLLARIAEIATKEGAQVEIAVQEQSTGRVIATFVMVDESHPHPSGMFVPANAVAMMQHGSPALEDMMNRMREGKLLPSEDLVLGIEKILRTHLFGFEFDVLGMKHSPYRNAAEETAKVLSVARKTDRNTLISELEALVARFKS